MIIENHEELVGQGLVECPIEDNEKLLPQASLSIGLAIAQWVEIDAHVVEAGLVDQLEMLIFEITTRPILPEPVPADYVHAPAQPFVLPERVSRHDGIQAGESDCRQGRRHNQFDPAGKSEPIMSRCASHTYHVRESLAEQRRKLNLHHPGYSFQVAFKLESVTEKRCPCAGADHNGRMIVNGNNSCSGMNRQRTEA
jgi:hypothetical protein